MTAKVPEIRMIPLTAITVLNPRVRNKKIFNELVTSIAHLGLKKPITVNSRPNHSGYDIICCQTTQTLINSVKAKLPAFSKSHKKTVCHEPRQPCQARHHS
jgi:ParB family chromosome partitioning protein